MSKGPGRVQSAILALIEHELHGAWNTEDRGAPEISAKRVYGTDGKLQRVAGNRARSDAKKTARATPKRKSA